MSVNILAVYTELKQKQKQKRRKIRIRTCYQCLHGRRYDSQGNEVMNKRIFCKAWQGVVYLGSARYCELFEQYQAPHENKRRKKSKRRW
jgi:hypothetical protein